MLKTKLLHPEILGVLGQCGHFSRVLIADGNYPFATMTLPATRKVYLNLTPGIPTVSDVLEALVATVPIQSAMVVSPPDDSFREIHREYARILPPETPMEEKERFAFYNEVKSTDTALVIATADIRRFANLLITIGVVRL